MTQDEKKNSDNNEKSLEDQFNELMDTKRYRKLGFWSIGIFFGGFILTHLEELVK